MASQDSLVSKSSLEVSEDPNNQSIFTKHERDFDSVPISFKQNNLKNFGEIHLSTTPPSKTSKSKHKGLTKSSLKPEGITDLNGNRIDLKNPSNYKYDSKLSSIKTVLFYCLGISLFFSLLFSSFISYLYKSVITLITKLWSKGKLYPIPSGSSACWAVESGPFGASSPSNIVITLKCKTSSACSSSSLIAKVTSSFKKVLSLRTNISIKGNKDYYNPYEKLRFKIVEKFLLFCYKLDQEFNVDRQILCNKFDSFCDLDSALKKQCEFYLETKLSTDRPQWRVHLLHSEQEEIKEYGLIFVVHHVYGDGISWLQLLRQIAVNQPKVFMEPLSPSKYSDDCESNFKSNFKSVILTPHYFAKQLTYLWRESNMFHGPFVKKKKAVSWTKLKISQVKCASQKKALTFTQVISHCTGGSFKKLFESHQSNETSRLPTVIFAISPYARFPYRDLKCVNNFYPCFTPLIVNREKNYFLNNPQEMNKFSELEIKKSNLIVASLCGNMISPLQKMIGLSARSTVAFTNVPGMMERMKMFESEDEVEQIVLIPPVKFRTGIVIGVFGYEDSIWLSICVDEVINEDPQNLANQFLKGFKQELTLLCEDQIINV